MKQHRSPYVEKQRRKDLVMFHLRQNSDMRVKATAGYYFVLGSMLTALAIFFALIVFGIIR